MNIDDLIRLIERLPAPLGEADDRDLDDLLAPYAGCFKLPESAMWRREVNGVLRYGLPPYIRQFEQAFELIPQGWEFNELTYRPTVGRYHCQLYPVVNSIYWQAGWQVGVGATPALALCSAALMAHKVVDRFWMQRQSDPDTNECVTQSQG